MDRKEPHGDMKILTVCQYYHPEEFRVTDICEQLVEDGHSVTVLTGLPNYPSGKVPAEYRRGRRRAETINGVDVLRCLEIGRRPGTFGLALNYASYMIAASVKVMFLSADYDVVLVYQLSPVTMALPGVVASRRFDLPLYLYCCDIWPESVKNVLPNEANPIYRMVKRFSTFLYSRCDAIGVTSQPFLEYFIREHSIPAEKLEYLPHHAEDTGIQPSSSADGITRFLFMGNIGIAQDIDCILDAAVKLRDIPRFEIHLVGDGSCLEASASRVQRERLDSIVFFHGRHPLDRMPDFYRLADACLLTLKSGNLIGLTMPSKLQGYMAAGKPVIAAIDGAAREAINDSRCGVCVGAGESDALAKVMEDFIKNPGKYRGCGPAGREYYEQHFSKALFMENLEGALDRVIRE